MSKDIQLVSPQIEVADSQEAVLELSMKDKWGDGLPIIPPTRERVEKVLEFLRRDPQEVIGRIEPSKEEATIESIVVNALAAGCLPEYVPVVIAAVEAMVDPELVLASAQESASTKSIVAFVNGPIRQELNINYGANCLGQGWRANATIGRAIRFIETNIGGGLPGQVDMATLGWPGKYTFCFGENEEDSPWEPYHVEKGFDKSTSTITLYSIYGQDSLKPFLAHRQDTWIKLIASMIMAKGGQGWPWGGSTGSGPIVIVTPQVALAWAQSGLSKADVKRLIWEEGYYDESDVDPLEIWWTLDFWKRSVAVVDGKIRCCTKPDGILLLVAGANLRYHSVVLPGPHGDSRPVTKPILPIHNH